MEQQDGVFGSHFNKSKNPEKLSSGEIKENGEESKRRTTWKLRKWTKGIGYRTVAGGEGESFSKEEGSSKEGGDCKEEGAGEERGGKEDDGEEMAVSASSSSVNGVDAATPTAAISDKVYIIILVSYTINSKSYYDNYATLPN